VPDPRAVFGQRIRDLRKARGLSQEELAHRAGIHPTYLGGIERGERNPALLNISRVAGALGLSLGDVFLLVSTRGRDEDRGGDHAPLVDR
jgi:transcriptional regulator with XRE-family HTH domain